MSCAVLKEIRNSVDFYLCFAVLGYLWIILKTISIVDYVFFFN